MPVARHPVHIFLSYADADRQTAEHVRKHLEAAGLFVWDAATGIPIGHNVGDEISAALKKSDAMVTLISPASAKSPYVTHEVQYALTQPRYRERLIPVMVRRTENFPWILKNLNFIDATRDADAAPKLVLDALRRE